jgi:hypothetical protein
VGIKSRGTTKPHSTGFGAAPAVTGTGKDQLALKLGQATEHCQHQPPMRGGRVRPCVGQALETRTGLADSIEDIQKVPRRAGEPIKPRHHQHVARLQASDRQVALLTSVPDPSIGGNSRINDPLRLGNDRFFGHFLQNGRAFTQRHG